MTGMPPFRLPVLGWGEERPTTRGECTGPRPCPWVSCRYHMLIDSVRPSGFSVNAATRETRALDGTDERLWNDEDVERAIRSLPHSCALDAVFDGRVRLRFDGTADSLAELIRETHSVRVSVIAKPGVLEFVGFNDRGHERFRVTTSTDDEPERGEAVDPSRPIEAAQVEMWAQ